MSLREAWVALTVAAQAKGLECGIRALRDGTGYVWSSRTGGEPDHIYLDSPFRTLLDLERAIDRTTAKVKAL